MDLLPDVIHVRPHEGETEEWVRSTLRIMGVEAMNPHPGSETVITRLSDILVIGAVRAWLETSQEGRQGWLGALRDPRVGRALAQIHASPEKAWTVASLADEAHMSRAIFAERFTSLIGVPPIQYLTRWRMDVASAWMRDEDLPVSEAAARLGYASDASFSRAFKRHLGSSPGAYRRQHSGAAKRRPRV